MYTMDNALTCGIREEIMRCANGIIEKNCVRPNCQVVFAMLIVKC